VTAGCRCRYSAVVTTGPVGQCATAFSFVPGDIDEFFPLIGQTQPEGWLELGRKYDVWIVGEPMVAK
jgi:hypothetical protein